MILSHRHKFIFFCNGKTGTTSIEARLERLDEGRRYAFDAPGLFIAKHIPPSIVRGMLPAETWSAYFKFVFVRNPFAWVVSQWKYNFKVATLPAGKVAPRAMARINALNSRVILGRKISELAAVERFSPADVELLFAYLRDNFRSVPYAEGKYQSSYVVDLDGAKLVDYMGRFETLARDYAAIAARLGLAPDIPHVNRTRHREFGSYYTADSAAAVARLWRPDFEVLGYAARLPA
jgi:hypothetical protein